MNPCRAPLLSWSEDKACRPSLPPLCRAYLAIADLAASIFAFTESRLKLNKTTEPGTQQHAVLLGGALLREGTIRNVVEGVDGVPEHAGRGDGSSRRPE